MRVCRTRRQLALLTVGGLALAGFAEGLAQVPARSRGSQGATGCRRPAGDHDRLRCARVRRKRCRRADAGQSRNPPRLRRRAPVGAGSCPGKARHIPVAIWLPRVEPAGWGDSARPGRRLCEPARLSGDRRGRRDLHLGRYLLGSPAGPAPARPGQAPRHHIWHLPGNPTAAAPPRWAWSMPTRPCGR
jgi:hypothetical protein